MYPTIIITFIYSNFFTKTLASDYPNGDVMWLFAISICAIIIAILSPFMGAIADRSGYRKTYLILCTWICVISTMFLYFPMPGQIFLALILVVISNAAFEMGQVFCNSYLPDIAPKEKIGRISGYGWSLGYFGGLVALAVCYMVFYASPEPINPLTGNLLNTENFLNKNNFVPLITVTSTVFAYFSIIILSFGDFSRYVKSESQLKKGNLTLILNLIIFSFAALFIVSGMDAFLKQDPENLSRILTNPRDIIGKIDNLLITNLVLIFIIIASASTNLIANFRLLRSLELSLKESEHGELCVISSKLTKKPKPFWGAYSISKAALELSLIHI